MLTERFCPAQQAAKCTSQPSFLLVAGEGMAMRGWGEVEAWSQPCTLTGGGEEWREAFWHSHLPAQSKADSGVTGTRARERGAQGRPAAPRAPGSRWLVPNLSPQI